MEKRTLKFFARVSLGSMVAALGALALNAFLDGGRSSIGLWTCGAISLVFTAAWIWFRTKYRRGMAQPHKLRMKKRTLKFLTNISLGNMIVWWIAAIFNAILDQGTFSIKSWICFLAAIVCMAVWLCFRAKYRSKLPLYRQ